MQGNDARKGNTWTWDVGVGALRLSERETMAHMSASMVTANVSKALALKPIECIFNWFFWTAMDGARSLLLFSPFCLSFFFLFFSFFCPCGPLRSTPNLCGLHFPEPVARMASPMFLRKNWRSSLFCSLFEGFFCPFWFFFIFYIFYYSNNFSF